MEQKTGLHFGLIQDKTERERKDRGEPETVSALVGEQEGFHPG